METVQTRIASVFESLKGEFGYKNVNEAPTSIGITPEGVSLNGLVVHLACDL